MNNLTVEDGLSLNVVTEILQDSRGFIWFGTYNGLCRYDGYNFRVYLPNNSIPFSISSHSIRALYEDSKGYIWVGTVNGLNRYDWRTEKFYQYWNDPEDSNSLSNDYVLVIKENRKGELWIGTNNGLSIYNYSKNNFTVIKQVSDIINVDALNSVTSIVEDRQSNTWLGTWKGLTCINQNGEFEYIDLPRLNASQSIQYNTITKMVVDSTNRLWISTSGNDGLHVLDFESRSFKTYFNEPNLQNSLPDNYVNELFIDRANHIWIGTKNGLGNYRSGTDDFEIIQSEPSKLNKIINDDILAIYEDRTGIFWFGTAGGISKAFGYDDKFIYVKKKTSISSGLSESRVNAISVDSDGIIWAGTAKGIDKVYSSFKSIENFSKLSFIKDKLSDDYVMSIYKDKSGVLWIGTANGGLNGFDLGTKENVLYQYNEPDLNSISNNGILCITEDLNGNLWIGTWWGLNLFDRKTKKFERFVNFKNNSIWSVYRDSEGYIWAGTDGGGVNRINPIDKTFTNFIADAASTNSIVGNRVISISESKDGDLWFCTVDGLSIYDKVSEKFSSYTTGDGLPSNAVNSLIEDNKGIIWISTDNGISKFDRVKNVFTNFNKRNGLEDIQFIPNTAAILNDGQMIFGNSLGLVHFNPDSIEASDYYAKVTLIDFKLSNKSVSISDEDDSILNESILASREIKIPYSRDVITFEFALFDYFNVKRNKFRYMLEGFDKQWNDVGPRNTSTYTNLQPGNYSLHVQASNHAGFKNASETVINLTITPLYYQTLWFKLLIAVGFLSLLSIGVRIRTRRILEQNRRLEKKVTERTVDLDRIIKELSQEILERKKAEEKVQASLIEKETLLLEKEVLLKEIHHRVKNNLQVISSLLYLNSRKLKDRDTLSIFQESQNRIKSIALIHERLYQSKDLGKIDFGEYIKRLTHDLFRSYNLHNSDIELELDIQNVFINIDIAMPCGLIINELISNSLKYAFPNAKESYPQAKIRVECRRDKGNEFLLSVSDNGIGMPKSINEKQKESLGLQLVETLVSQLQGILYVDVSAGTKFIIKFELS